MLRVDLVFLVLVQIGNGLLLFPLEDELEAMRVDTLGLSTFLGLLIIDPQVGGLGEKSGATRHGCDHEKGEERFEARHAFSFSHER